ncbi:MAG: signal peptidase I [Patescibacteria group bacterium]
MHSQLGALTNSPTPRPRNLFLAIFVGTVVFIYDVFKTVTTVLGVAFLIRFFLIQPFYVSGQSMEPNFENNQYIIVDQISYRFHTPRRGDVIVFKYPLNTAFSFIKRIVALPGEQVSIHNGKVTIYSQEHPQGFQLVEPYTKVATVADLDTTLEDDEYFVLGDNRPVSSDSRSWGVLPRDKIIGRVWVVLYPFEDFESIHTPTYSTDIPAALFNPLSDLSGNPLSPLQPANATPTF